MLVFKLPKDIESRLIHLAERTGRTKTFYAREAILRFIDELEKDYVSLPQKRDSQSRLST
jgi:RHH-type rel operon transcriptional repressor/antitoxin RelB